MLRALFLLSFVGGTLYAGLVATHSALSPDASKSEGYSYILTIRPPGGDADSDALRSWGPTLQALRSKPQAPQAAAPAIDRDNRPVQAALSLAAVASAAGASQEERIGWAKLTLAARGHEEASVSSPITHFYRAGSKVEIIGRDGAWMEVRDPATNARGWVFEQYVAMIDEPSATQVAAAEPEPAPMIEASAKPKPTKVAAKAKKRSIKPQATTAMLLGKASPEGGRVVQRGERRGLGLFLFGRRLATLEAEGRVAR